MLAVGRIALMSGELGHLNGLPVSVIIRTTLQDLESRAGIGVTGGGTRMPIADVIKMGAHANHHLAVFDGVTGQALALYRTKRVASPAQRIMLIARDGGCTKPCCTVGAYGCQAHHASKDWAKGGNTNVDEMTLACGPTTAPSTTAAGRPPSTPAANANGGRHPISTTANPASTTTTAPKHSSDHPRTSRAPNRHHQTRSDATTPTSTHGTSIPDRHPADPNHPTTKPHESHGECAA